MNGHLVIADISGYTRFLTESELEHANDILSELLNATIDAIDTPLRLSSIEGDAVLVYGELDESSPGQVTLERVENLYMAFANALETMVLNTTCQCNACVNINTLGMKIVMHCGEFTLSSIGGRETITGPDVILTHRLLKNHVIEETGIEDYLLLTDACVKILGLESVVAGWKPHREEYEHIGVIDGHVGSLREIWEFNRRQNENKVLQRDSWLTVTGFTSASPEVVWDVLTNPLHRKRWMNVNGVEVKNSPTGETVAGSEFHCAHGPDNEIAVLKVLDSSAGDYLTLTGEPVPGIGMRWTEYVVASGEGTRLIQYTAEPFDLETGGKLDDTKLAEAHNMVEQINRGGIEGIVAIAEEMTAGSKPVS